MTERGVYLIDRGLFGHERFADEPFTEREAWVWMIGQAAFKPHSKRVGSINVELRRGQFAHSLRFMAEKWKWAEPRVRRFLSKLKGSPPKRDALIDAATDAGVTVITICKYSKWQQLLSQPDAPTDAPIDAKKNLEKQKEAVVVAVDARAREPSKFRISPEAAAFAEELAKLCGHDLQFLPVKWVSDGPAVRVQMMLDAGWHLEVMRDVARARMRRWSGPPPYSIKYFEPIFATAHAPQLPLPIVQVVPQEASHGQTTQRNSSAAGTATSWQQSKDAFRSARVDLKAALATAKPAPDGGSADGGPFVRLAAPVGRR